MGEIKLLKEIQELKEKYCNEFLKEYEVNKSRYESAEHFILLKEYNLNNNTDLQPENWGYNKLLIINACCSIVLNSNFSKSEE